MSPLCDCGYGLQLAGVASHRVRDRGDAALAWQRILMLFKKMAPLKGPFFN
jgi:hypothetical protein